MPRLLVVLTIAAPLLISRAIPGAAQALRADSVAGCYSLTLSSWSPVLGEDAPYYAVPSTVRLDTAVTGQGPGRKLTPNIPYPHPREFPGAPRWEIRDDRVVLTWSNGFTPTIISLRVRDSVLVGTATALSDAGDVGPRPRATATARRRPCA